LDIVKTDADFADVLDWISCGPEADQRVHLAHEAFFSIISQSEPDLAVPHPCFEVIDQKQGLSIDIDVDAAIAIAIGPDSDLHALQQVMELCRPFNDGVLAQWHRRPSVWMILQQARLQQSKRWPCFTVPKSVFSEIGEAFRQNPDQLLIGLPSLLHVSTETGAARASFCAENRVRFSA
jgi:hypothetical protein